MHVPARLPRRRRLSVGREIAEELVVEIGVQHRRIGRRHDELVGRRAVEFLDVVRRNALKAELTAGHVALRRDAEARVIPFDAKESPKDRLGFMKGELKVPKDFDDMGRDEIGSLFTSGR